MKKKISLETPPMKTIQTKKKNASLAKTLKLDLVL